MEISGNFSGLKREHLTLIICKFTTVNPRRSLERCGFCSLNSCGGRAQRAVRSTRRTRQEQEDSDFFFMMNVFVELGEGAAQLAASPAASVGPCCAKAWS